jgi:hypothetical protein
VNAHEGFDEGATWAWYWTPAELAGLARGSPAVEPPAAELPTPGLEALDFEAFVASVSAASRTEDEDLVRAADLLLSRCVHAWEGGGSASGGQDRWAYDDATRGVDATHRQSDGADFGNLDPKQVPAASRARVAVLRTFNCIVKRALPVVALDGPLGAALKRAKVRGPPAAPLTSGRRSPLCSPRPRGASSRRACA